MHKQLDGRRYFGLCLSPDPLFTGMDWKPLHAQRKALANATALPEVGFDWPAGHITGY